MARVAAGGRWWRWREPGIRGHQAAAGWLFLAPVIVILGVFLLVPIAMAAWVSVSDWNGNGSPFGPNAHYVGLENYRHLLTTPGSIRTTSARQSTTTSTTSSSSFRSRLRLRSFWPSSSTGA